MSMFLQYINNIIDDEKMLSEYFRVPYEYFRVPYNMSFFQHYTISN